LLFTEGNSERRFFVGDRTSESAGIEERINLFREFGGTVENEGLERFVGERRVERRLRIGAKQFDRWIRSLSEVGQLELIGRHALRAPFVDVGSRECRGTICDEVSRNAPGILVHDLERLNFRPGDIAEIRDPYTTLQRGGVLFAFIGRRACTSAHGIEWARCEFFWRNVKNRIGRLPSLGTLD